eukprot:1457732-Rhodomonas_salina.2
MTTWGSRCTEYTACANVGFRPCLRPAAPGTHVVRAVRQYHAPTTIVCATIQHLYAPITQNLPALDTRVVDAHLLALYAQFYYYYALKDCGLAYHMVQKHPARPYAWASTLQYHAVQTHTVPHSTKTRCNLYGASYRRPLDEQHTLSQYRTPHLNTGHRIAAYTRYQYWDLHSIRYRRPNSECVGDSRMTEASAGQYPEERRCYLVAAYPTSDTRTAVRYAHFDTPCAHLAKRYAHVHGTPALETRALAAIGTERKKKLRGGYTDHAAVLSGHAGLEVVVYSHCNRQKRVSGHIATRSSVPDTRGSKQRNPAL